MENAEYQQDKKPEVSVSGPRLCDDDDDEKAIGRQIQEKGMILFTTTFYTSIDSTRFQLCLAMINEAHKCDLPVVIVDSSPNEAVHEALQKHIGITRLARQTYPGRKGAGLREAAQIASELPGVTPDTMLCFQEPEKVLMPHCWCTSAKEQVMMSTAAAGGHPTVHVVDVMVMYRSRNEFQITYPIEQYHSEMYGNLLLDQVAKNEMARLGRPYETCISWQVQQEMEEHSETTNTHHTLHVPCFDWHFGPFAFRAQHVQLWTKYSKGDMYDAQLVPMVHAFRKGLEVYSVYCNYRHPPEMKREEQGNVDATLKRLQQLHDLDPRVIQAWTEDFYC